MNLFVNAAQAIEDKGSIAIAAQCDEQWCTLTITDDGPGIADEALKQIFEPFFTTKPIGQGTGLGLSISHDIIQHHGGTMTVKSSVRAVDVQLVLERDSSHHNQACHEADDD